MRVFVTGGTGLLGNTILRELTKLNCELVSLVRRDPEPGIFDGINTELVCADLLDREVVTDAIAGCDAVIHSAGLIHLGWKRLDESMRVNRDGARVIVDACCKHNAALVHIGTVNTLAVGSRKSFADEETPLENEGGQIPSSYVLSKRAGMDEFAGGVSRKLNAVALHPGLMFGPWDWKPSSGRMIAEVAKTWRPIAPSGGCSVCDSRDVAAGVISAMQRLLAQELESGREFILAGDNWTYYELWKQIARMTGARRPIMPAGPGQRMIGQIFGDFVSHFSKEESDLNSASVKMSSQYHWYDCSRAKSELGYRWRDPMQSLQEAVNWLSDHGQLKL